MGNRTIIATALFIAFLVTIPGVAQARTWYVNVSGTGDAPTIAAALDSAAAGDTVLVGPGDYTTSTNTIGSQVVVISEAGPLRTRVVALGGGVTPVVFDLLTRAELRGFWVTGAYLDQVYTTRDCIVSNNIIEGFPGDHLTAIDYCTISNNLFLAGQPSSSINAFAGVFLNNIFHCPIQCSSPPPDMLWNNILSPDNACLQSILQTFGSANFSANPQFCGIEGSDNYYLQSDSPCAPGNAPLPFDPGLIGPLPVGCSTVNTEERSWGEIKAMYRD